MNEFELMQEEKKSPILMALLMAVFYGFLIDGIIGYFIGANV